MGHGRDNDRTTTTPSSSVVCTIVPAHVYAASARKQQSASSSDDAAHAELKAASADALLAGGRYADLSSVRQQTSLDKLVSSSAAAFPTSQCELVTEGAIQTAPGPIAREFQRCISRKPFNQITMPE